MSPGLPAATVEFAGLVRGAIESLADEGATLLVVGWCVPFAPVPVVGFAAAVDHQPVAIVEQRCGLDSPDIAAVYPRLPTAPRARFALRLQVAGGRPHRLVQVTALLPTGAADLSLFAIERSVLPPPPARRVASVGGGAYEQTALEFLSYCVGLGGARPDARVLDVGCGIGRMAHGLTAYLREHGRYLGIDVVRDAVAFAGATIGARFQHFRFEHVDLRNGMYNPAGELDPLRFAFPVGDGAVDLVLLSSVVTHLMPPEAGHYLAEIGRVLAPGGVALVSAFVLLEDAQQLVAAGRSSQAFAREPAHGCWVTDAPVMESAVGFDLAPLRQWLAAAGLQLDRLAPGSWCGRWPALSYQDLLVLRRPV